jgi:hypothetical protein
MKKLVIAWIAAAALVSLSACSSEYQTNTTSAPGMTNTPPQSYVPFPDNTPSSTTRSGLPPPTGRP